MDHVAILRKSNIKKSDNLFLDIMQKKKTIESRWYVNKIAPWNNISAGDKVYLKESGEKVKGVATVSKVKQYENLNYSTVTEIIEKYGKQIAPHTSKDEFYNWAKSKEFKRYCILIFLENPMLIKEFEINKKGFGISSAWLCVGDINKVKINEEF